jgi:hypothetical protein
MVALFFKYSRDPVINTSALKITGIRISDKKPVVAFMTGYAPFNPISLYRLSMPTNGLYI